MPPDDLDKLGLSRRAHNVLVRSDIRTIADLLRLTDSDLLGIRRMGPALIVEIREKLRVYQDHPPPSLPDPAIPIQQNTHPFADILNPRQIQILEMRYGLVTGDEQTLADIAEALQISRQRVLQLEKAARSLVKGSPLVEDSYPHLLDLLIGHDGIATEPEMNEAFMPWASKHGYHPLGLLRLVAAERDGIASELVENRVTWILDSEYAAEAIENLEQVLQSDLDWGAPRPRSNVVSIIRAHPLCLPGVPDHFVAAFLRVHPRVSEVDNSLLVLKSRSRRDRPPRDITPAVDETPVITVNDQLELPLAREHSVEVKTSGRARAEPDDRLHELRSIYTELVAWEDKLQPLFDRASLVGEVRITRDECKELGTLLGQLLSEQRQSIALRACETLFPATFATFLVAEGVYGYKGGDYWTGVSDALGLTASGNLAHRLARTFEAILQHKNLPLFPEMRERTSRYVSLILAHGGIPAYCLADYFSNIIAPAIRPPYDGLVGEEAIAEILRRSASRHVTDKPVLYFLENGGAVAYDFFERTKELAQEWQEIQNILAPEQIGLPEHVVSFFGEWAAGNLAKPRQGSARNRSRFIRPELLLRPWDDGFVLRLPPQPVSSLGGQDVYWSIDELGQTLPACVSYGQTAEAFVPLGSVLPKYTIRFRYGESEHEWSFETYSLDRPLLVFNPETGAWQPRPTQRELWLCHLSQTTLNMIGSTAHLTEELPALPGGWRGQGWDLGTASVLEFVDLAGRPIRIDVRAAEAAKPTLVGGILLQPARDGQPEVYANALPSISIPAAADIHNAARELERWSLTIRSLDTGMVIAQKKLGELSPQSLALNPGSALVKLDSGELLSRDTIGTFSIHVRGPMGRDASFVFRYLPAFECRGVEHLLIPDSRLGAPRARLEIVLPERDRLNVLREAHHIQLRSEMPGHYHLVVPGQFGILDLQVTRDLADDIDINIPVRIHLRRIRWRLTHEAWSGETIRQPLDAFLQKGAGTLLVDIPGIESSTATVLLRLLNIDGVERQIETCHRPTRAPYWRVDLGAFTTTLRDMRSPIMRFELECRDLAGAEPILRASILSLERELDIHSIQVYSQQHGDSTQLVVTWEQTTLLRSRVLYLWPLWRPWDPPLECIVDDANEDWCQWSFSSQELTPGCYRLEFAVRDPWIVGETRRVAPPASRHTIDWPMLTPVTRLEMLKSLPVSERAFDYYLEQISIHIVLGQAAVAQAYLKWCIDHLEDASARQLVALWRFAQEPLLTKLAMQLGVRLFEPVLMKWLLNAYQHNDISFDEFTLLTQDAPAVDTWPDETCQVIGGGPETPLRPLALQRLAGASPAQAVPLVLTLIDRTVLTEDDAVALLTLEKYSSQDILEEISPTPQIRRLLKRLRGGRAIKAGDSVKCNAGIGRIEEIEDDNGATIESFIEGEGSYHLVVVLHLYESADFSGERVSLDMRAKLITFPRAKALFTCQYCGEFVSARKEFYRSHLHSQHPGSDPAPAKPGNKCDLTALQFLERSVKHE